MKNDQALFAKILEDIKYTGRSRGGYVTEEEVKEALEQMELTDDQFTMVYDYLSQNNIGIGEPLTEFNNLSDEDKDILKIYQDELKELDTITDGEKRALLMSAMNNDSIAQEKILTYYLPKVIEVSKLYTNQGVLLEDLIGEGNLALAMGVKMLDAMETPDEADSMLVKMIMDAMEESIKDNFEESSKDQKMADKVNKVSDAARELSDEVGRNVTVEELADNTKLSKKMIKEAIKLSGNNIEYIDYEDIQTD